MAQVSSNQPDLCAALLPSVNLVQIPQAEALLHADCNGKEVTCEISHYFLQATENAAWFITNVQVSGGGPSVSMVMKSPRDAENGAVLHPTLNLPLSPQGMVQTAGEKIESSSKKVWVFFSSGQLLGNRRRKKGTSPPPSTSVTSRCPLASVLSPKDPNNWIGIIFTSLI